MSCGSRRRLNGRVVVRGDFDALTGEMLLSALSNLTMPTPAPDGTPDSRSAAKRTADGFTELIRRYLDCAKTGTDGGQRPHVNVHINARDLAEHRDCAATVFTADSGDDDSLDLADLDVGHMPWLGPLSVSQTRLLGCDCFLSTVLLDDHGAPLDAKPGKRLVTAEQRSGVDCPRQRLRLPGLHMCTGVDGCAPYPALGQRWPDGDEQPGPAVPFASPVDAPQIRVRREVGDSDRCRQQTVVHPATLDRPAGSTRDRRTPPSKPERSNLFGDNRTRTSATSRRPRCGAKRHAQPKSATTRSARGRDDAGF